MNCDHFAGRSLDLLYGPYTLLWTIHVVKYGEQHSNFN